MNVGAESTGIVHLCRIWLTELKRGGPAFFRVGIEAGGYREPKRVGLQVDNGLEPVAQSLNAAAHEQGGFAGVVRELRGFRAKEVAVELVLDVEGSESGKQEGGEWVLTF